MEKRPEKPERYQTLKVYPDTYFAFEQMRNEFNTAQRKIHSKVKFLDYLVEKIKKNGGVK